MIIAKIYHISSISRLIISREEEPQLPLNIRFDNKRNLLSNMRLDDWRVAIVIILNFKVNNIPFYNLLFNSLLQHIVTKQVWIFNQRKAFFVKWIKNDFETFLGRSVHKSTNTTSNSLLQNIDTILEWIFIQLNVFYVK